MPSRSDRFEDLDEGLPGALARRHTFDIGRKVAAAVEKVVLTPVEKWYFRRQAFGDARLKPNLPGAAAP
jgi:hypothetical protein